MSASFSLTSLRSFGSSKSLASFVNELSAAKRFAEVASTGAAAQFTRRRPRPDSADSAVLPGSARVQYSPAAVQDHVVEYEEDATAALRRRVRLESVLPDLLFDKPVHVAHEAEQTSIRIATVGARRCVGLENVHPDMIFPEPSQAIVQHAAVEEPRHAMPESMSSPSMASMSSSKSLTSFEKDLFATGRLGDLNTSGFEARAYRRRVRAASGEQHATKPAALKASLGVNVAAKSSTMSLAARPLVERSPFTKYTPSGALNLSSVRDRSGKSFGASPSFFADLEPEQEFRLRGALLLPGMQFTSSTVGAEKSDVLRSLTGELPEEKTSKLGKIIHAFKHS
ncbi:hypothetical protein AURDEDRAFT_162555 [Auricularia subglabra TFB-10046 SS5]|nr:hypothetical protein AURDEDRAFT_162555 [Auricularia subglabra TFB-10046 SS5]